MDFYLDENLPKSIAHALNVLEKHEGENNVFSTEEKFEKGVKDVDLIRKLEATKGILITHDLKMKTRWNEFSLLKELEITTFLISLPSGASYELTWQTIFEKWVLIKKICKKEKRPFVCRMTMNGKPTFL